MKIVSTFHQPSSVLSSVKCRLSTRDLEHLVVAKTNRIDIYSLQPHGLQHEHTQEIWGKILCVKAVPIPGSIRSNVLLMIDHPDPELILFSYTESDGTLSIKKQLSLHERTPRQAEFFTDVVVHPSGKVAVVSCYAGKLKVVKFKAGNYESDFDVSASIALKRVQLLARDLNMEEFEISSSPSISLYPTIITPKILPYPTESVPILIPVPPVPSDNSRPEGGDGRFLGGILVLGGRRILLYGLASPSGQDKQKGKRRRLETRKRSGDSEEAAKARAKEIERETKEKKPTGSVDWPWSHVTACCGLDQTSLRFFIGDMYGKFAMLSLDSLADHGLLLIPIGETSPATTLTYLTNQTLYVGSHLGDSQLIQVSTTPVSSLGSPTLPIPSNIKTISLSDLERGSDQAKGKARAYAYEEGTSSKTKGLIVKSLGSYISTLDVYKNIGPIKDAILVDTDGSGQRQIVTCSGGRNTGSVNVVRNGADLQEFAYIPGFEGVTDVWPIRMTYEDDCHSHILVSTLQNSQLFQINDEGGHTTLTHINEDNSPIKGIVTHVRTIIFGNVPRRVVENGRGSYTNSQLLLQVTTNGAFLLDYNMAVGHYDQVAAWEPLEIVAASMSPSQVLLALSGGRLVLLSITDEDNFREMTWLRHTGFGHPEVSALTCIPLDSTKYFTTYVAVSYWHSNTVEIFSITPSALVRSILLHNFGNDASPKGADYNPHLLVGLSDGSLVTFSWKDNQLKDRKITSLGDLPVSITACEVEGKRSVFASGNQATVLSWENKRLRLSPIMLKNIVAASRINTRTFGRCVRDLDKMHIRSIPFGLDNPGRVIYEPSLKVFGVAYMRTEPERVGNPESSRSCFVLLDDITFDRLGQFNCDPDEEIFSITTFAPTIGDKTQSLFCVGTYLYREDETEPSQGRLIIFRTTTADGRTGPSTLQLSLLTSKQLRGCVTALTIVDDMILAAVNSSVLLFRLAPTTELEVDCPTFELQQLSEWNHNYLVGSLASCGNRVVVGDHISSVSLLDVSDSKMKSIARDYCPLWPICVEATDEKSLIGANDALNLFTFSLDLDRTGSYHVADLVTKIIRGGTRIFTSMGRIGIIVDVADNQLATDLTELSRNMGMAIQGVGGISHARYRAPRDNRGPSDADVSAFGFLDGDFLERFLNLGEEKIGKIMTGQNESERLGISRDSVQKTLENLQSMH
ncbi:CPSF A subunit region-domain-containing protein [Infundibulicybe gibba]|nr:CPSF A subunit region-domain-containing protein [Infundibulicybe gibba]